MKFKWERFLNDWSQAGLITPEQVVRIRNFEASRPQGSNYTALAMTWLGVFVIGIGVISLVAANWASIPDFVKLLGAFGLTGGAGYKWLMSLPEERLLRSEAWLGLFLFFVLATIGLISQIYHLGGKLQNALLFWSLITSLAAVHSRSKWIAQFWVGIFLGALTFVWMDSQILGVDFRQKSHYLGVLFGMPFLTGVLALLTGFFLRDAPMVSAFRYWLVYSGVISLLSQDIFGFYGKSDSPASHGSFVVGYLLATLAVLGVWLQKEFTARRKILLLMILFLYVAYFQFPSLGLTWKPAYGAMDIIILLLMAAHVVTLGEYKLFDGLIGLIALRFLGLYFQAFGGLAATGLGLIISGFLILWVVSLWHKKRHEIQKWAERVLQ